MEATNKFPLLSGNISLDLVNTEVVRWGQRYDLFANNEDIQDWLYIVKKDNLFWNEQLFNKIKKRSSQVASNILEFRNILREEFEAIANQHPISSDFISFLEKKIEKAPFTYKLIEQNLIPFPIGEIEDILVSLIAFDVLTLLEENKLTYLKRCSNSECVLLFIDLSGRRKWCSMKICGNRKKVARFQHRKEECD
ncbi:CGNR zinc finger domain-containing protein [Solibacillus isronensis]|uniref:CGNR zinc finger domain-containing protein n=1 Tax=Solibacillus isronensis TaxID=412383 RepID=UPI002041D2EB|nr:CGNR zinc finger domain-containing protein [Solibacillus isronensis]MCM3720996.1 CGNR zinc finger domain-containing protein [Solibacillus isronensis]